MNKLTKLIRIEAVRKLSDSKIHQQISMQILIKQFKIQEILYAI